MDLNYFNELKKGEVVRALIDGKKHELKVKSRSYSEKYKTKVVTLYDINSSLKEKGIKYKVFFREMRGTFSFAKSDMPVSIEFLT